MGMTKILTPRERELARHSLGLHVGESVSLRNIARAHHSSSNAKEWTRIVAKGLATVEAADCGYRLFRLTRAGALAALEEGEELDSEDFPR